MSVRARLHACSGIKLHLILIVSAGELKLYCPKLAAKFSPFISQSHKKSSYQKLSANLQKLELNAPERKQREREEGKCCNTGLIQIELHSEQHNISSLHLLAKLPSVTTGIV